LIPQSGRRLHSVALLVDAFRARDLDCTRQRSERTVIARLARRRRGAPRKTFGGASELVGATAAIFKFPITNHGGNT